MIYNTDDWPVGHREKSQNTTSASPQCWALPIEKPWISRNTHTHTHTHTHTQKAEGWWDRQTACSAVCVGVLCATALKWNTMDRAACSQCGRLLHICTSLNISVGTCACFHTFILQYITFSTITLLWTRSCMLVLFESLRHYSYHSGLSRGSIRVLCLMTTWQWLWAIIISSSYYYYFFYWAAVQNLEIFSLHKTNKNADRETLEPESPVQFTSGVFDISGQGQFIWQRDGTGTSCYIYCIKLYWLLNWACRNIACSAFTNMSAAAAAWLTLACWIY